MCRPRRAVLDDAPTIPPLMPRSSGRASGRARRSGWPRRRGTAATSTCSRVDPATMSFPSETSPNRQCRCREAPIQSYVVNRNGCIQHCIGARDFIAGERHESSRRRSRFAFSEVGEAGIRATLTGLKELANHHSARVRRDTRVPSMMFAIAHLFRCPFRAIVARQIVYSLTATCRSSCKL